MGPDAGDEVGGRVWGVERSGDYAGDCGTVCDEGGEWGDGEELCGADGAVWGVGWEGCEGVEEGGGGAEGNGGKWAKWGKEGEEKTEVVDRLDLAELNWDGRRKEGDIDLSDVHTVCFCFCSGGNRKTKLLSDGVGGLKGDSIQLGLLSPHLSVFLSVLPRYAVLRCAVLCCVCGVFVDIHPFACVCMPGKVVLFDWRRWGPFLSFSFLSFPFLYSMLCCVCSCSLLFALALEFHFRRDLAAGCLYSVLLRCPLLIPFYFI